MFDLTEKKILVTGGLGHLGGEICKALIGQGAYVFALGRSVSPSNNELARSFLSDRFRYLSCDLTDPSCVETIRDTIDGSLNVVVNNAFSGDSGTIETSSEQSFRDAYDVGMGAVHRLSKGLLPNLRLAREKCEDACFINIASMYGMVSPDLSIYESKADRNPPFYGAVKAALIQYTRYAAAEFGSEGIRSNSISYGPFPNLEKNKNTQFLNTLAAKTMLQRIGNAREAAGAVAFLASDDASFITGSNIVVDGGWTAW